MNEREKLLGLPVTPNGKAIESHLWEDYRENAGAIENKYKIENIPGEVMDICREIEKMGGRALLVGGSVRDAIMSQILDGVKIVPKDFDLEVYKLSMEDLQDKLISHFGEDKVVLVGRAFGVIKVRIKSWEEYLDFSGPRTESKTGKGHKGFEVKSVPSMKIVEAAKRRDITINSIAYDPLTDVVYDPHGGIPDILGIYIDNDGQTRQRYDKEGKPTGIIRMVDKEKFMEDPIRVLRVMQFAARYGFLIDEETEKMCKHLVDRGEMTMLENINLITEYPFEDSEWEEGDEGFMVVTDGKETFRKLMNGGLAKERVAEEIYKLLTKGKKPSVGFNFARRIGLVRLYWPDLQAISDKDEQKWDELMDEIDKIAEETDLEIKEGKLPSEKELRKMERVFKGERDTATLEKMLEVKRSEIESVSDGEIIKIIDSTSELARSLGMMKEIARRAIKKALLSSEELNRFRTKLENIQETEVKIQTIDEMIKEILSSNNLSDISKRDLRETARVLADKEWQKAYKRLINDNFEKLEISQERKDDLESLAYSLAGEIMEKKRRKRIRILREETKVTRLVAMLCRNLDGVNENEGKLEEFLTTLHLSSFPLSLKEKIRRKTFEEKYSRILSDQDIMEALDVEVAGPWMSVIHNCLKADDAEGLLTRDKGDAKQAAVDYFNRLSIWVNAKVEMIPPELRNKKSEAAEWKKLSAIDARTVLKAA